MNRSEGALLAAPGNGRAPDSSRRDPMKVAQQFTAGSRFLREIRPERDDRWLRVLVKPHANPRAERFYRPLRDGRAFLHHIPALKYWAIFVGSLRD